MKNIFIKLSFLFVSLFFIACSRDTNLYDPSNKASVREANFTESFVRHYGEIAPDQTWGFDTNVSSARTRTTNVDGNLWYRDWERPVNVTDAEKDKVIEEFSKKRENAVNVVNITWENYWVQQVYKGEQTYIDGFLQNIGKGSDHMNKIMAYNDNYTYEEWWPEYKKVTGGYEHINNFNFGDNSTVYTDDETGEKYYGTTLMVDMKSDGRVEQFCYHNTTDSKDHYEYIILEIDGAYYLGFDFYATHPENQASNLNMDVDRDWVFNDWIVKITPAYHKGEGPDPVIPYAKRIICEDLGSTDDFDFNDVVFDAYIDTENDKTYIKLQAAGGILSLKVAGHEVHSEFGVDQNVMVNTGLHSEDPVEFVVDGAYANYNAIPVTVEDNRTAGQFIRYELKSEIGRAPQKICVDTDYEWCTERQNIEDKYPLFKFYVGNPNIQYGWYK